ncbi:MAG: VWA domain-containing protein [Candidatus Kapabacteria bacterium]|nr:VWA domain-containing protein [Ignavibacteriota bacterium]MCW5883463.1 VWA domain-containing protein [Candidatus Kapabacteria bacterium]
MKTSIIILIFVLFAGQIFAQSAAKVSGTISSSENGEAIGNATVILKGSIHFTHSDAKSGKFMLNIDKPKGEIVIHAKGFESVSIPFTKDSMNLIVSMTKLPPESDMVDNLRSSQIEKLRSDAKKTMPIESRKGGHVESSPLIPTYSDGAEVMLRGSASSSVEMDGSPPASIDGGFAHSMELEPRFPGSNEQAESGLLTAGEVNDFSKWVMWNDIADTDLSDFKELWKLNPKDRFTVLIENEYRTPVYGATVNLLNNGYVVWSSRSDNTGKAELWLNPFTDRVSNNDQISIEIEYSGLFYQINNAKKFSDGINFFKIKTECLKPKSVDIVFLVDATGSMGDEINYLKMDLKALMQDIQDTIPDMIFNLGSVFYRDTSDAYITRYSDFSSDISVTTEFINEQGAAGGGDFPEAVHRGLDIAINQLSWTDESMTKIIFLVLDAPPHSRPDVILELQSLILKASEKGIRVIPVACSGVDKSTEYFLRATALLTNGTYTFLTDDSGIGNPHIKPTTDKFDVETLRQLLIRLVYQYTYYPDCDIDKNEIISETISIDLPVTGGDIEEAKAMAGFKYYPNPTYGDLNIEFSDLIEELFIADVTGKIIFRLEKKSSNKLFIDISKYPTGMYYIMYQYKPDKWLKGKIMLMH